MDTGENIEENILDTRYNIYRVRMYKGSAGGSNYYLHADIIAANPEEAFKAAEEGRVYNWRVVDRFDIASQDYIYFELLYQVSPDWAKNPSRPQPPQHDGQNLPLEDRLGE